MAAGHFIFTISGNRFRYADQLLNIIIVLLEKVKNGVSLGLPLSNQLKSTGLFPPMVVHMVGIGEETGNVEEMLTNSAVYYEEEVEVQTQTLTSLMEPIIIVLMALVVVMLILAIYQPMIQLYNTLGNA